MIYKLALYTWEVISEINFMKEFLAYSLLNKVILAKIGNSTSITGHSYNKLIESYLPINQFE